MRLINNLYKTLPELPTLLNIFISEIALIFTRYLQKNWSHNYISPSMKIVEKTMKKLFDEFGRHGINALLLA